MDRDQAIAVWKSILRNHPFFNAGGMFGYDWPTFRMLYPQSARVLKQAITIAKENRHDDMD